MAHEIDDEDVCCSRCNSQDFVKNGKVRTMQRFRCKACGLNFVGAPKHRWPPSSKIINLISLQSGDAPTEPVEAARIDRWLSEAKEHHPWFIRALAELAVNTANQEGETIETTLKRIWEIYAFITKRNPEYFYDALATKLYVDMFNIGDERFQEGLMTWLREHSLEAGDLS